MELCSTLSAADNIPFSVESLLPLFGVVDGHLFIGRPSYLLTSDDRFRAGNDANQHLHDAQRIDSVGGCASRNNARLRNCAKLIPLVMFWGNLEAFNERTLKDRPGIKACMIGPPETPPAFILSSIVS